MRIPRAAASARTARLPCCRPRDRFSTQRQPLSCALAGHAASGVAGLRGESRYQNCLGRLAACCNSSRAHERSCTKAHDFSWNLTCVLDHHRRASLALKLYILGWCLYRFIATGLPSRNPWCTVPNPPWPSFLVSRRLDTSILGSLALSFTPDVGCHSALFFLDLAPGCPKR